MPLAAKSIGRLLSCRPLLILRVEESKKDTEKLWCRTKILLVPSTWCEAFGLVVVEAMLRGIPVISSDAGGLVEVYLIPISPPNAQK